LKKRWTDDGYAQAIARACAKAGVPAWAPNRVRHSFATDVRAAHGLEAAQVLLGHSRADVTQIYAERDQTLAEQVAAAVG
jgi:site-specific recombinase XerC